MKKCPYCAEEIQDAAILCKHCKSKLPGYDQYLSEEGIKNDDEIKGKTINDPALSDYRFKDLEATPDSAESASSAHEKPKPIFKDYELETIYPQNRSPASETGNNNFPTQTNVPSSNQNKFFYPSFPDFLNPLRLFNFSGLANRTEFAVIFWGFLFAFVLIFVFLDSMTLTPQIETMIANILGIIMIAVWVAVTVRRLHDIEKTGWTILVLVVPLVNIYLLLLLFFKKAE